MEKKFVFIDRDGTMGGEYYVEYPQQYTPYDGTREAIALLKEAGYTVIVLTNQSCIARKKDGGYDFGAEFREMGIDDWFICPHDSMDGCNCRKPASGLFFQAQERYGMKLSETYMIGDRWSDMVAGGAVGAHLVLVLTGRGQEAMTTDRDKWSAYKPMCVMENLLEAAKWITNQ